MASGFSKDEVLSQMGMEGKFPSQSGITIDKPLSTQLWTEMWRASERTKQLSALEKFPEKWPFTLNFPPLSELHAKWDFRAEDTLAWCHRSAQRSGSTVPWNEYVATAIKLHITVYCVQMWDQPTELPTEPKRYSAISKSSQGRKQSCRESHLGQNIEWSEACRHSILPWLEKKKSSKF